MSATLTPRLTPLRSRLAGLGQRRRLDRWLTGWSGLVIAILIALALAFLVDYSLRLRRIERLASLLMVVGFTLWAFRKFTRPFLFRRESLADLALLVEQRQKIDTDLVAALEFDGSLPSRSTQSPTGSAQLRTAVVDYVSDFTELLNVHLGEDRAQPVRRLRWAGGLLAVGALALALFPGHGRAFFNRLLLGSAHYPSRTHIDEFFINGRSALAPLDAIPEGAAIRFSAGLTGLLPEMAELRIVTASSGARSTLLLARRPAEPTTAQPGPVARDALLANWYEAEIPRLTEEVLVELVAGDDLLEPVLLRVSPRPGLAFNVTVTPPAYAKAQLAAQPSKGNSSQLSVLEGSRVDVAVTCPTQPLREATFILGDRRIPMVPSLGQSSAWLLPENLADHPLKTITQPLSFEIDARNTLGVGPAQPLAFQIRLLADRLPRIVAAVVTERVLPTAKPSIVFGATDDFGLAEVRLNWQVRRAEGQVEEGSRTLQTRTPQSPATTWRDKTAFDLKPLKLIPGEEVRVTLAASDYRGETPGQTSTSETIVLQVTDESGILAGLAEADEKSARQLDTIIERQLGIGAAP
jgi:hypothetical protein